MADYEAVVEKVVKDGKHGAYAVARCEALSFSITFSLSSPVWDEKDKPEEGTFVSLSDIRKKRAGWRAMSARYVRPTDKKSAISH
jgi:hypothetical protein